MNLRGGWALIRFTWTSWLQYRGFFFVLAFGWMVPPLVSLLVWWSAAGSGEIGGLSRGQFAAYYLLLILVNQLTYSQTNWTVGDIIRDGSLSAWLLRPMAPVFNALSSEVAGKVVYLIFSVPAAGIVAAFVHPEFSADLTHGAAFLVSLTLAWILRFCWGLTLALLAFWTVRADALLLLQDTLVFLFGGMVAPVALLPAGLRLAAQYLPFRYMLGFPVETLTGQVSGADLASSLVVQFCWAVTSILLAWGVWKAGQSRFTAVGG